MPPQAKAKLADIMFLAEGVGSKTNHVLHRGWGARHTLLGLAERLGALDKVCLADRLGALDTLCLADGLQRGWGRKTHYALHTSGLADGKARKTHYALQMSWVATPMRSVARRWSDVFCLGCLIACLFCLQ